MKSHTLSYKVVNQSLGTYKPFSMLEQDAGSNHDPDSLSAAKEIASKLVALGGDRVSWNVMSERFEFLHLRRERNEVMSNMWQLYLEESKQVPRGAPSSSSQQPGCRHSCRLSRTMPWDWVWGRVGAFNAAWCFCSSSLSAPTPTQPSNPNPTNP